MRAWRRDPAEGARERGRRGGGGGVGGGQVGCVKERGPAAAAAAAGGLVGFCFLFLFGGVGEGRGPESRGERIEILG